jgi:hypothetical protein
MLARVMVTLGVVGFLLQFLVPDDGLIPLVAMLKSIASGGGRLTVLTVVELALIVLVILSLLAWMPAPATGGAKVFAWLVLLSPIVEVAIGMALDDRIGELVSHSPGMLAQWVPGVAYAVLVGYGGATVIGKQLE